MDRLDNMQIFAAVAEESSFTRGARRLGLSAPAATRAVAALEERVGTQLLRRTTRVVRLTDSGRRFLLDCKRILAEVDEAEASVSGLLAEPRGQLAVTAPLLFGRRFVAPLVLEFSSRHRHVTARLLLLDRVVDLIEEGLDVAVRIAHLPDSSYTAARVGTTRRVVCASPAFLARHGTPRTPSELRKLAAITFSPAAAPEPWSFAVGPRTESVVPRSELVVNNAEVAIAAAAAGRGVTRVLSYQVASEIRAGKLRVVLGEFEPPPIPIHVVHAERRRAAARVRAFVDFAVEALRSERSLR